MIFASRNVAMNFSKQNKNEKKIHYATTSNAYHAMIYNQNYWINFRDENFGAFYSFSYVSVLV